MIPWIEKFRQPKTPDGLHALLKLLLTVGLKYDLEGEIEFEGGGGHLELVPDDDTLPMMHVCVISDDVYKSVLMRGDDAFSASWVAEFASSGEKGRNGTLPASPN